MTAERVRILATAELPTVAREALAPLGEVAVMDGREDPALRDAEVLIVRADPVDDELLEGAPRLRAIARTGTGLDLIDVEAVTRHGIPLLYAPAVGALAIAEGTLALILASLKRLPQLHDLVVGGMWEERYEPDIRDIAGTTLGVVGFGRIGREVARLASAIGMDVIAHDPQPGVVATAPIAAAERSLEALFAEADVITLHCPLTERTRHLVDGDLLARAKPGAILVNASRGELIAGDEALLDALADGRLSAVALDVFAPEPPRASSPLLQHPRVLCTPHAVGLTRSWNRQVFGALARDLARLLDGQRPEHLANPEVLEALSPGAAGG